MRIGILAYLLHRGSDYRAAGVSAYIGQLLAHLPVDAPEHRYVAYRGRDGGALPGVEDRVAPVPTWLPPVRILWEQLVFPIETRSGRVDLVHGTVNALPLLSRPASVVTVHDLAFLRHPERFRPGRAQYLRTIVSLSVRKARMVIAVSESTRGDLIELLQVDPDRVTVTYPGVDDRFRRLGRDEVQDFRERATAGRPYLLHVGTLEPRKNIDVLIAAYAQLRRSGVEHALVLVGARGWMYDRLFALVRELEVADDVLFVDFVAPDELPLWYNGADLFAYPSAYEGFGLPVLEAMACGVPVVTSASSSLAELAGSACLTVEPGSQEALQVALAKLLIDQDARARLTTAGLKRAAEFSWSNTARQTARTYERAAGNQR